MSIYATSTSGAAALLFVTRFAFFGGAPLEEDVSVLRGVSKMEEAVVAVGAAGSDAAGVEDEEASLFLPAVNRRLLGSTV